MTKDDMLKYDVQKQEQAYNALKWLLSPKDEDTGTGRSYVLARVAIDVARANPGCAIPILPHVAAHNGLNYLRCEVDTVRSVIDLMNLSEKMELRVLGAPHAPKAAYVVFTP